MSVVRRLLLFIALLLVSSNSLKSQDCDALSAGLSWDFQIVSTPLLPGDEFFVECFVTGFTDVLTFQYSLNYNPNVIEFQSVDNTGSPLIGLVDGNFTTAAQETGSLPLIWTNGNGEGQTLPPNTAIFKLFFEVIGDPDECSQWDINSSSVELEIAFELPDGTICAELVDINFGLTGGELCIECQDLYLTTNACGTTGSSGSIQFSACGGTAPYTYNVEGPSGPIDSGTLTGPDDIVNLTDLEPGLYFIDLMDATGTSIPFGQGEIDIIAAPDLTVDVIVVNEIPCPGFTGDIEAFAFGGATPYIFEWSNGLFSSELEDLPEGSYTVTVTDANGCQAVSQPVTLETFPLDITVIKEDATCGGSLDGSITLIVTGGTPVNGDSYFFDQQLMMQGEFVGLDPGTFLINIRDDMGCEQDIEVIIEAETEGFFEIDIIQEIECFGDLATVEIIGDINQAASLDTFPMFMNDDGEQQPYGYFPNADDPSIDNIRFFNIEAGFYEGFFFNNDGCRVEVEFEVTGDAPEIEIELVNQNDFDCSGNGGEVEVEINGGVGALSPLWSTGETDLSITVPSGGTYTITVTDENLCTNTLDVDFTVAGSLGLSAEVVDEVGCGAASDSGSAQAEITATSGNITYSWLDAAGNEIGTDAFIDGLSAGTFTVIATDTDQDCSEMVDVTISGAGTFIFDTVESNPDCFGGDNGEIEVSIVGGAGSPTFAWAHDEDLTFNLAQDLTAGVYVVTVTDADGCELDTMITLENPPQADITVDLIGGVSCFNGNDGSAIATASNSPSGETEFTYFWLDGNGDVVSTSFGELSEPNDLISGELFVYAFDGCPTDTISIEIPNGEEIIIDPINAIIQDPSCNGLEDGLIELALNGGTVAGDYGYQWETGETTNTLSDLGPGFFTVSVTDDNNCEQEIEIELTEPDSLLLELGQTAGVSCFADTSAVIEVFGSGGTGGFEYTWTPEISTTNIANQVPPGVYVIQVTDSSGCTAELTEEVVAATPIIVSLAPVEPIPCSGGTTLICFEEVSGGSGNGYMYQTNFGVNTPVDSCFTATAGGFSFNVTDSAGCSIEEMIEIFVDQPDPITVDLGESPLELNLGDDSAEIDAIITGPNPIDTIIWSSDVGEWECLTDDCSSINITPTVPSFYFADVTDVNGCATRAEVFVDIKTVRNVWAPNIFTPDRDGMHDIFHPFTGPGVRQINSFYIYDRWGNLMHSAEDILPGNEILDENSWDGQFNGDDAAVGVYVYIIEVEFVDDEVQYFKGSITLTR